MTRKRAYNRLIQVQQRGIRRRDTMRRVFVDHALYLCLLFTPVSALKQRDDEREGGTRSTRARSTLATPLNRERTKLASLLITSSKTGSVVRVEKSGKAGCGLAAKFFTEFSLRIGR